MIDQTDFFKIIESRFTDRNEFLQAIMDVLCIELSNVHRRINGTTLLNFKEQQKLIAAFDIRPEEIYVNTMDRLFFNYRHLNLPKIENYKAYLEGLLAVWEKAAEDTTSKISIVTDEIPIFYFMAYPRLTMFKLYCYSYDMNVYKSSFESFIAEIEKHDITEYFERIRLAYDKVDSLEIWDDEVLSTILHDFNHKRDLDCFANEATLQGLKEDLRDLISDFRKTVVAGEKKEGANWNSSEENPSIGFLIC